MWAGGILLLSKCREQDKTVLTGVGTEDQKQGDDHAHDGDQGEIVHHLPGGVVVDQGNDDREDAHEEDLPPNREDDSALKPEHQGPLAPHKGGCAVLLAHGIEDGCD